MLSVASVTVLLVIVDQLLHALTKQIEWHWPEIYGQEHFVIILPSILRAAISICKPSMMGDLHIEMVALKILATGWMVWVGFSV